jgi:DNA oxidative demethylase
MDLFTETAAITPNPVAFATDAYLLQGGALLLADQLIAEVELIAREAPLRHMTTKMGFAMSAKMTNCGALGWVSDRKGYRYSEVDPLTLKPWPAMPAVFVALATLAAKRVGFSHFAPDACLINAYQMGASMGLHQDIDEEDFSQPIVSVSLGLAATFLFGGFNRTDKPIKLGLNHGDIVVWGGESRRRFHGIMPIKQPKLGEVNHTLHDRRINLTFRKAR